MLTWCGHWHMLCGISKYVEMGNVRLGVGAWRFFVWRQSLGCSRGLRWMECSWSALAVFATPPPLETAGPYAPARLLLYGLKCSRAGLTIHTQSVPHGTYVIRGPDSIPGTRYAFCSFPSSYFPSFLSPRSL